MTGMTHSYNSAAAAREHARTAGGQFGVQEHSDPDMALTESLPCTEGCGRSAMYRLANVARGYRAPASEPALCPIHASDAAADGFAIEEFPKPQQPGEVIVWLIEGDDREFELVEAATEEEALDIAADRFSDRYDDDDEDEDNDDVRDLLTVAGTFRGDADGYTDELEFVPHGDIDENTAYDKLQNI